jgi:hypothetical protein
VRLNSDQQKWIKFNVEMLDGIFRSDLDEMKQEVFTMADSKSRNLKIEFINKYQKLLAQFGIIKGYKKSNPESEI